MAVTDKQLDDILAGLRNLPDGPWYPDMNNAFDPDDGSFDGEYCDGVFYVLEELDQDHDGNYTGLVDHRPENLDICDEDVARHVARLDPQTVQEIVEELQAFRAAQGDLS